MANQETGFAHVSQRLLQQCDAGKVATLQHDDGLQAGGMLAADGQRVPCQEVGQFLQIRLGGVAIPYMQGNRNSHLSQDTAERQRVIGAMRVVHRGTGHLHRLVAMALQPEDAGQGPLG
ncbi:hypothetical protein D3C80_1690740 [compost metagenome]